MINQLNYTKPRTSTAQTLEQLPASDYDHTVISACGWYHCHCPSAHAPASHDSNHAEFAFSVADNSIPPFRLPSILELIPPRLERPPKA